MNKRNYELGTGNNSNLKVEKKIVIDTLIKSRKNSKQDKPDDKYSSEYKIKYNKIIIKNQQVELIKSWLNCLCYCKDAT